MKFDKVIRIQEEAVANAFLMRVELTIEGAPKRIGYLQSLLKGKKDINDIKLTKNITTAYQFFDSQSLEKEATKIEKFCNKMSEKYNLNLNFYYSRKSINKYNNKLMESVISEGRKSVSWNSREDKNYNKHKYHWEEGNSSFKAGRERIVSAVCNRIRNSGSYIDRGTVRNYLTLVFDKKPEDRPDWVKKAVKRAKALGYSPDDSADQKKINNENKKGYKGRAVYFAAIINGTVNHFKDGGKK